MAEPSSQCGRRFHAANRWLTPGPADTRASALEAAEGVVARDLLEPGQEARPQVRIARNVVPAPRSRNIGALNTSIICANVSRPPSASGRKPVQRRACSSDRKRFMRLQLYARLGRHSRKEMSTNAWIVAGSAETMRPSRTTTRSASPQSRQGASMVTSLPGKSQQTASASKPHWANQRCCPSTLMRYCVGTLLNGAKDAT